MDLFSTLRPLSESLNQASAKLNQIVNDAQNSLRHLNLGVEAWSPQALTYKQWTAGNEVFEQRSRVGWARHDREWCLVVRTTVHRSGFFDGDRDCPYEHIDKESQIPLLAADRQTRAEAIDHFLLLEKAITKAAQNILEVIERCSPPPSTTPQATTAYTNDFEGTLAPEGLAFRVLDNGVRAEMPTVHAISKKTREALHEENYDEF